MSDVTPTPTGACSPYATVEDFPEDWPCLDEGSGTLPVDIDELLVAATDIVWVLLGRPNLGACEVTIYPCQQVHRWRWWGGSNNTSLLGANGPCVGCGIGQAIRLNTPVRDVAEVVVDDDVLATDDFYLLDGIWLVRCAGAWPAGGECDFERFSVTYSYGEEPSQLVTQATVEVAMDLWVSRPGQGDLEGVTSVNRQGIGWSAESEIERVSHMGMAMPSLAKAVELYNPARQSFPPLAWSPDEPYRNRTIRTF